MPDLTPKIAIFTLSFAWMVSWLIAAWWVRRVAERPAYGSEALHLSVTIAGCVLLFGLNRDAEGLTGPLGWAMVGVAAGGYLFCWWARLHLGTLWSGSVTRKDDHYIVESGPYGLVRHPIYTGLIVSLVALAVAEATSVALVGAGLVALGFYIKARLEERFLREQLGPEAYDGYRHRVPMLIPWRLVVPAR
jgi:protein-S-isoprenylcysteine O-methyltransferase Ste14